MQNKIYKLKYLIIISQLYPKIIEDLNISNDIINKLKEYENNISSINNNNNKNINNNNNNFKIIQLQLLSTLHNEKLNNNFYFTNIKIAYKAMKYIITYQNLKNIEDIYDLNKNNIKEVGSGHFGKVYLIKHKISNEKVCMKILNKFDENLKNKTYEELSDREKNHIKEDFKCCQWEKEIFKFLIHQTKNINIIRCYEYIETPFKIYFINENCPQGNLKLTKIPFNNELINNFIYQLINGIYTLHKYGIIHRDIKTTNVLLKLNIINNKYIIKIIDFGLSKIILYNEYANETYGSLPYKCPEIIKGKKYNFLCDIWALGISIYWLIYGKYPCLGESKNKIKNNIIKYEFKENDIKIGNKNDLYNIIMMKCLVNDYKKRWNVCELKKFVEKKYKECSEMS